MPIINAASSHKLLKSINQKKVLRLIFTEGPISRVELSKRTGLTQQTITNIAKRLLGTRQILELPPSSNQGGRKPIPLAINSEYMYAIGIEIAVKYVRGSLMDFRQKTIKELVEEVPRFEDSEHTLHCIYKVVDKLLEFVPEVGELKGIGCSIQALVDPEKGVIIYSPGLNWIDYPLKEKLNHRYKVPIHLENDVNLLAIVENLNGHLSDSTNNISLKFDHGIGGAMIINKKLNTGAAHVAGEFGHYKAFTDDNSFKCHCGNKGCLTTLASISGLKRNGRYTLDEFNTKIRENDSEAMSLFHKIKSAIVLAVSNIITFLNPDSVIITGRLFDKIGDVLMPSLKMEVYRTIPDSCRRVNILCLKETPNESSLAVGLVMNHFFNIPLDSLSLQG